MKISVLTPSFNAEKYLSRAIESVLMQDYKNWEHIVMDGGSTDKTTEILKRYKHIIWESKRDKGQSEAMNRAFEKATGDIIMYLNVDDALAPGVFSRMIEQFKADPQVDMVVGNLNVNDRGEEMIRIPVGGLHDILNLNKIRFPQNPVSYAYKKALQTKVGQFPIENHYSMDYWFLLRAYLHGKIKKIEFTCGTYYSDGNNKSADVERGMRDLKATRRSFLWSYFYKPAVSDYLLKKITKRFKV